MYNDYIILINFVTKLRVSIKEKNFAKSFYAKFGKIFFK